MFPKRAPIKLDVEVKNQEEQKHSVEDEDVKEASDSAPSVDPI